MRKLYRSIPAAVAASALAVPAVAQDGPVAPPAVTVTGAVALASQYRFRGISLSDERAALQGTVNVNHRSGFYGGIWGSNLDGFGELGGSNLELDLYAGFRRAIAVGVTVDAGLLYYAYPGSSSGDFEFFEPYANVTLTRGPVTAKLGIAWAPSQDGLANNANRYLFGDLALAIPNTPTALTGHLGNSHGRTPLTPSGDYLDWSLGATATWGDFTFGVSYIDTSLNAEEAASGGATRDIVDPTILVSLTASF